MIPDKNLSGFETVEAWEKRTGRKYPETAPVYEKRIFAKPMGTTGWICHGYQNAVRDGGKKPAGMTHNAILVATDAGAPDYDWMPEENQ